MSLFERYRKNNINESVDWEKSMDGNDNNLDRIKRLKNLQVDIPPVMGDALEDDEKFDKNSKEVFTKLAKDAKDTIPENPGTGKKITLKPYTEKLTLDEGLFKESWTSFGGSWRNQTVKKVNYTEEDISDIAEELMNWYGEYFEGWEGPDIKDALYGLDGEKIPGSDCPIIFTMEEDEDDELDWGDDEEYDESLNESTDRYFIKVFDENGNYNILAKDNSIYSKNYVAYDRTHGARGDSKKIKKLEDNDRSFLLKYGYKSRDSAKKAANGFNKAEIIKISLDESFNKNIKEGYGPREYSEKLFDMVQDGIIDAKGLAKNLIYWLSEDDVKRYMEVTGLLDDENMDESLNEDYNLLEYASEDEEDDYTVVDLLNDRLFGYGINKSNFRMKWKFAEVEPTIKTRDGKVKRGYFYPTAQKDEMVTGKADDRRAFVEEGIGVLVHDEDEALLAKKCAEELGLEFTMKKLVKPINGCEYTAVIKVPEDVQEMTVEEYMKSIGKSMSDLLRGKGEEVKFNFKDSANYKSRKNKQDSE